MDSNNNGPPVQQEAKITLSGWSELALLDRMLDKWFENNGKRNTFYTTAEKIRKRLLPVLTDTTIRTILTTRIIVWKTTTPPSGR